MPAVNHSANLAASIRNALRAYAPMTALVGFGASARIYGGMAQQGSALPRIIFHEIAGTTDHTHDSATTTDPGIEETVIQFDCEARTLSECRAVADVLAAVFNGASPGGSPASIEASFKESGGFAQPMTYDSGDGVAESHRWLVDYRFLWRDA